MERMGSDSCLRLLRCGRLQGLSDTALSGSRGILPTDGVLSNELNAHELTLARLHD
jgi:hypothetical protein